MHRIRRDSYIFYSKRAEQKKIPGTSPITVSPIDALFNQVKCELLAELKKSIMEDLKPVITDLIKQAAQEIKDEDEYQLIEWFIKKYPMSRKTFYKYKKLGYVDSRQVGKYKMYNVKQWLNNISRVKGGKPDFLKIPLGKVG